MIEVYPKLHVGNQLDYEKHVKGKDWCVVQACKEPYHREALGYSGRGLADKDNHEYLFAYRSEGKTRRLILNMVDAPKAGFFADKMIDEAINFINTGLTISDVLVHCNQGLSRSPSLAMLYLRRMTDELADMDFEAAEDVFRGLYPQYDPGKGIREYVKQHWQV